MRSQVESIRPRWGTRAAGEKEAGVGLPSFRLYSKRCEGKGQPVYAGGRVVGVVRGDVFIKHIRGSVHMLQRPPAIAFDVSSLADAARAGAAWAEVTDTETGQTYRARLDTIRNYGRVFNRGYGEQIYLPLAMWGSDDEPAQLSLFAEVER